MMHKVTYCVISNMDESLFLRLSKASEFYTHSYIFANVSAQVHFNGILQGFLIFNNLDEGF